MSIPQQRQSHQNLVADESTFLDSQDLLAFLLTTHPPPSLALGRWRPAGCVEPAPCGTRGNTVVFQALPRLQMTGRLCWLSDGSGSKDEERLVAACCPSQQGCLACWETREELLPWCAPGILCLRAGSPFLTGRKAAI